jgi:biopolymer transport protein ExbD
MAFGSFDNKGGGTHTMAEINMVPLIDVMLVLLVIFIITAPLLANSIKINIPRVSSEQIQDEPKAVDLAIDPSGQIFVNDAPVVIDALQARFAALASAKPQPEIRIRADVNTRYEILAEVMAAARRAGMARIGFVTTPQPPAAAGTSAAGPTAHPAASNATRSASVNGANVAPAPATLTHAR